MEEIIYGERGIRRNSCIRYLDGHCWTVGSKGLLADFGAEVIKVEMPRRGDAFRAMGPLKDGVSIRWPSMGRNKKSVTLDFHFEEGKKLFLELVKKSDVIIENFKTGTLDKWNLGMDVLRKSKSGYYCQHM